ncbi:hypothetical protein ACHAWF_011352 [Thalassiosira exigua]
MGANSANVEDDIHSVNHEDEKQVKKHLLIDTIKKKCASSSQDILQRINHAINVAKDGSVLEATVLSGGYTNYSYKVRVGKHPELVVFAKLCFDHAMWNPDENAHHDLKRTENEYEIMKKMSQHAPESVVSPLALWDLEHEGQTMKLLVTEWSRGDEQFCNQFIDGAVDPRIAPKIASTLAALHSIKDFDPNFNVQVNDCVINLFEQLKEGTVEACNALKPKDRTESYCNDLGEEVMTRITNAVIDNTRKHECLIHSDAHPFNTLVEAKPSVEELGMFGPEGTMCLCDWEMACAGPIGKDIGLALTFPLACMVSHALNGHREAKESITTYINSLLDTYKHKMFEAGKSREEVTAILRNIYGWAGWFSYGVFYVLDCQTTFPVESDEQKVYVRDSIGVLGLKLLRLSFDTDYIPTSASLEEVQKIFNLLWREEITRASRVFASGARKMQPRRSSVLRAENRRLSDAAIYIAAESLKGLSFSEADEGQHRFTEGVA